ncbi:hypothetical protein CWC46_19870 [Prodigiosinella confusarubida]|uniref:Uncharacterized protein n=1 Tax=Serratia sp. (strain ATCC 39006) TaxID=104623 RepID=A0A2I5TBC7_SERS3|nr:hypothetical protein CWC46_19870 [Serratia sp. ATCC 39006]AUH06182.1 hypothetical protein Ser39006_019870 [Serratia sp. ATCC 39006]
MGFSYGLIPGRNQHDVLDALSTGLVRTNVSWVLDAKIIIVTHHNNLILVFNHPITVAGRTNRRSELIQFPFRC